MRKEFDEPLIVNLYEKANVMGMGVKLKERVKELVKGYILYNELNINVNDRNAFNTWVLLLTTNLEDKSTGVGR